jgi:hypothetical protein
MMAEFYQFTEEQKAGLAAWLAERPPQVRALAERFPPNQLFRLKTTGQIVSTLAFAEDGTLRVLLDQKYNPAAIWSREVFGINPDDLEPCEVPKQTLYGS